MHVLAEAAAVSAEPLLVLVVLCVVGEHASLLSTGSISQGGILTMLRCVMTQMAQHTSFLASSG